jgi:S1-C subfamily serine protease
VGFNEHAVASIDDLHRLLADWPIQRPATLTVIRGPERLAVPVNPTEAR